MFASAKSVSAALCCLAVLAVAGAVTSPSASAAQNTSSGSSQQACEEAGYMWSSSLKKCANRHCTANGHSYSPGSSRLSPPVLGTKRVTKWCDGFSGTWGTIR